MGCYEYLKRAADSDGDTMTDGFEDDHGLDPTDPADADGNPDHDPFTSGEEFICDTDPTDSNDYFCITGISAGTGFPLRQEVAWPATTLLLATALALGLRMMTRSWLAADPVERRSMAQHLERLVGAGRGEEVEPGRFRAG